jgi:hypothetical protein
MMILLIAWKLLFVAKSSIIVVALTESTDPSSSLHASLLLILSLTKRYPREIQPKCGHLTHSNIFQHGLPKGPDLSCRTLKV